MGGDCYLAPCFWQAFFLMIAVDAQVRVHRVFAIPELMLVLSTNADRLVELANVSSFWCGYNTHSTFCILPFSAFAVRF